MPKNNKALPPPSHYEQTLERPLPSSENAERTIVGGILIMPILVAQVFQLLQPEDFYSPLNRRIMDAVKSLHRRNEVIDPVTVVEEMKTQGVSDAINLSVI